jgi:alpha-L-arabinofuranosidase
MACESSMVRHKETGGGLLIYSEHFAPIVNTFDAPNTIVPKLVSAKAQDGKLTLKLEPKSMTVVAVEQ